MEWRLYIPKTAHASQNAKSQPWGGAVKATTQGSGQALRQTRLAKGGAFGTPREGRLSDTLLAHGSSYNMCVRRAMPREGSGRAQRRRNTPK